MAEITRIYVTLEIETVEAKTVLLRQRLYLSISEYSILHLEKRIVIKNH